MDMNRFRIVASGIAALTGLALFAEPAWSGDALKGWMQGMHQVEKGELVAEGLRIACGGADTHIYSPAFRLPARATQEVVFRARGNKAGTGELFWMPPGKGPTQKLSCSFEWIGDGQWHEYRLRPYWQGEKEIGKLRLDFPGSAGGSGVYDIEGFSIQDGADALDVPADGHSGVSFTYASAKDAELQVQWAGDGESGVKKTKVRVPGDGRVHRYYLHLCGNRAWKGRIGLMKAVAPEGLEAPKDLKFETEEPELPADVVLKSARMADAFNRVGQRVPLTVLVGNLGSEVAEKVEVVPVSLPKGVRVVNAAALTGEVLGGTSRTFDVVLDCASAGSFTAGFEVRVPGAAAIPVQVPVTVLPSLDLPKADYVPEPKPVETDYDIGALYFPGWARIQAWERVWKVCPERKPALGWYDEANPEVVDWQIKWVVENGIRTLYVDWYWSKGSQHLDHWVKAFYKAKYRKHVKWAMMWANHNAPGSHSEADQRAVTKFWIENYFNTPEYLRIDGKPVVWMWSPQNMQHDMDKQGGCRRLLEISREMAVAAGFKGIYFIAMKWPEDDCRPKTIQMYKDFGFDMTGIYHFMSHGGVCPTNRRFPYSAVADANPANWWKQHEANVLPFLPNLSTGWDDRPWNDHCEIHGKNAADFRRICAEAKKFADQTGIRRLCLAPLNEWGEGSYAEPNTEHGFGFYEAVRDTFCRKPAAGWPLNYGPKDVGLGPYDLPPPAAPKRVTSWDFTSGRTLGWHAMMGVTAPVASAQGLSFATTTRDPALSCSFVPLACRRYTAVEVTMKAEGPKGMGAQLFWSAPGRPASERTSVCLPVVADGTSRTYVFKVAASPDWRGRVDCLRFDPCNASGAKVTVESIRLR